MLVFWTMYVFHLLVAVFFLCRFNAFYDLQHTLLLTLFQVNANTLLTGVCFFFLSLSAAQLNAMLEKMCSRNALDDLCALLLLLLCCTWCVHDFQQHKIDGKRAVGLSCIVVDVVSCNLMTNSENILIFQQVKM